MRKIHLMLALAAISLLSAACGNRRDPDMLEVATFGGTDNIKLLTEKLAEFGKKTGIKAKPVFIPWANYSDKIISQMAANAAPDIIWTEVGFYVRLQHAGALLPLNEYIKQDKLDIKKFYPGVMTRFSKDGQIFALPQDTAPIACVYYNKTMFKEAKLPFPKDNWTWKEFLADAKKLTKKGKDGKVTVWGFKDNYGPDWASWIYSNGGTLVDDWRKPTKSTIASPAAIEAVQFTSDLVNLYKVSPSDAARESVGSTGEDMFRDGKIAMLRSGYWVAGGLNMKAGKDLDWDMVPTPIGPRAKGRHYWGTGGSGWAMSRNVRNKENAWKVIQFLASEDFVRAQGEQGDGGIQPAIRKLAASNFFMRDSKPKNKRFMLDAPDHAIYSPTHNRWEEALLNIITPRMDTLLMGKSDIAKGMKEISDELDKQILSKKE